MSRNTDGDLASALGRIKTKTYVMPISHDMFFPPSDCEVEQRLIPGSQFRPLKSICGGGPFPIVSDVKGEVGAAFGLRFNLPDYLVELYKDLKADLASFNDDSSWTLPMPARYIIGQNGVILYSEVNPDYTRRPEQEDMIPALRRPPPRCDSA